MCVFVFWRVVLTNELLLLLSLSISHICGQAIRTRIYIRIDIVYVGNIRMLLLQRKIYGSPIYVETAHTIRITYDHHSMRTYETGGRRFHYNYNCISRIPYPMSDYLLLLEFDSINFSRGYYFTICQLDCWWLCFRNSLIVCLWKC